MIVLGFDIATKTGWAVGDGGRIIDAGTWELAHRKEIPAWTKSRLDRRADPRPFRLFTLVKELVQKTPVDLIVFEDVEFSSGRKQMHLWASLRTAIWLAAPDHRFDCLNATKLKKFATGNPHATKEEMSIGLVKWHPDQFKLIERNRKLWTLHLVTGHVFDDNAVDAINLALWANRTYRL